MQTITRNVLKDTLYYKNIPVLVYNINYPSFDTTCNTDSAQLINCYYACTSRCMENYCRTALYSQAAEIARYIPKDQPFHYYELDMDYKITYNKGCIISLYMETYEYMGGAHGETKRTSDTWDFATGDRIPLNKIYPLSPASLYNLQAGIEQQIARRLKTSPGSYFGNYSSLLQNFFNPSSFYLLPDGMVIYYQQYDIAPYVTGIPEFILPQHDRHCCKILPERLI